MSHKLLLFLALVGPILLIAAGGVAAEESDQEPPVSSQKFRTEATWPSLASQGLDTDKIRRQLLEESSDVTALQLAPDDHLAFRVDEPWI